jgi:outer membrane protein OmpA-like peptidoglycan-associated protein
MKFLAVAIAVIAFTNAAHAQQSLTTEDIVTNLGAQPSQVARQEGLTTEGIVSALGGENPRATSRGLGAEEFKTLKGSRSRGFNLRDEELKKVEEVSESRPKVDLAVYFDYNSAEITPQARVTLDKLGAALQDSRLAGKAFLFNGHTDARGAPKYNEELSFRRALSVQRYIVDRFRVDERNIIASGHGSRVLKNAGNPFAEENRRVEVARAN